MFSARLTSRFLSSSCKVYFDCIVLVENNRIFLHSCAKLWKIVWERWVEVAALTEWKFMNYLRVYVGGGLGEIIFKIGHMKCPGDECYNRLCCLMREKCSRSSKTSDNPRLLHNIKTSAEQNSRDAETFQLGRIVEPFINEM